MAIQDLTAYNTVKKWMDEVNRQFHLSDQEWEGRLDTLGRFCEHIGKDPDTIIAEARGEREAKLDFMRALRKFAKSLSSNEYIAHDYQNVIRSFFIHNGARVTVKPYAEVYKRGG
jgi:hypothetical protein